MQGAEEGAAVGGGAIYFFFSPSNACTERIDCSGALLCISWGLVPQEVVSARHDLLELREEFQEARVVGIVLVCFRMVYSLVWSDGTGRRRACWLPQ